MATTATLTINAEDIIGADFDKSRASVWVEANTEHGLIVVDGTNVRVGGRRENLVDGVATFNLVTTDSADNPTSFGYRVTITYVPKGSRKQGHDTITTSDFPFTASANLAAIPEAWDNVTAPVEWRNTFRDEMEAIRDSVVDLSGITTSDTLVAALVPPSSGSATSTEIANRYAATRVQSDGSQITVQKGSTSYLNWVVAGSGAGYGIHITSDPAYAGSGLIGVGNDYGTSPGILINNKAGGAGLSIHNQSTVTGTGVGFVALQSNTTREFARWEQQQGATRAPLAHLIATSTNDDARLFEFARGGTDTLTAWFDNRGRFHVKDIGGNDHQTTVDQDGFRILRNAGAPGSTLRWGSRVTQTTNFVQFLATQTAAAEGSLSFNRKYIEFRMDTNALGFFGVTPVNRQALGTVAATDLASAIAVANACRTALINFGLGFSG